MTQEQVLFELAQSFEMDAPNDARATDIERSMQAELRGALVEGADLKSLECRRNMCRAVIGFPSEASDMATFDRLLRAESGPFAQFPLTTGREGLQDGPVTATVFVRLQQAT